MLSSFVPGKKIPPPYVSYRTFLNFLDGMEQTIPARIDRSYWGSRFSGSNGSQLTAALRFLDLIDTNGFPTMKLKQLVVNKGSEKTEILKRIVRESYAFLAQDAPDPQTATYAQLEEAFHDHFQLASDVARKCIKFYISLASAGGVKLSPFITGKTRSGAAVSSPKRANRKFPDKKYRTENPQCPKNNPDVYLMDKLLIDKFPNLDPGWPDDLKSQWFSAFNELLKRAGNV
jgi:hypothetical protein